jgi:hypothetical protein
MSEDFARQVLQVAAEATAPLGRVDVVLAESRAKMATRGDEASADGPRIRGLA